MQFPDLSRRIGIGCNLTGTVGGGGGREMIELIDEAMRGGRNARSFSSHHQKFCSTRVYTYHQFDTCVVCTEENIIVANHRD